MSTPDITPNSANIIPQIPGAVPAPMPPAAPAQNPSDAGRPDPIDGGRITQPPAVHTESKTEDSGSTVAPAGKKGAWDKIQANLVAALEKVESGESIGSWQRMWDVRGGAQQNLVTKHEYSGGNAFLTVLSSVVNGWGHQWCTFNQAKKLGGMVNKGERATYIIRPIPVERKSSDSDSESNGAVIDTKEGKKFVVFSAVPIFNVDQTNLFTDGIVKRPGSSDAAVRKVTDTDSLAAYRGDWDSFTQSLAGRYPGLAGKPTFGEGGDRAFYVPARKHIQLPMGPDAHGNLNQFHSLEEWMSTDAHEKFHFLHDVTGLSAKAEASRRDAKLRYADEEQRVEGATLFYMVSRGFGSSQCLENSTRYLCGWNGQAAKMSDIARADTKGFVENLGKGRDLATFRLSVTDDPQWEVPGPMHNYLSQHYAA